MVNNKFSIKKESNDFIVLLLLIIGTILTSFYNYLLFHTLAEMFSIIIAGGIFIITWNSRKKIDNSYFLVIGISSLFVGFIDLIHTLAYTGMPIFIGYDSNLPTQLWIAARYLQAFSFLVASLLINKKIRSSYLIFGYIIISGILLISIFLRLFPDCFIEGSGLTPFKIISEYIIISILIISIFIMFRLKENFDERIFFIIILSLISTMIAEFAFTFYISVYGVSNLIGHVFKIIAFFLIYKAIIQIGLENPINFLFRKLKLSEEKYRESFNRSDFFKDILVHDMANIFQNVQTSIDILLKMQNNHDHTENSKKLYNIISKAGERGILLINNVRKLSRIEQSKETHKYLDLQKFLNESIKVLNKNIQEKEIIIDISPLENNLIVDANELLLDAFENILTNAVRHNNNSIVKISIMVHEVKQKDKKFIRLEFQDNGVGISDDKKELIFKEGIKENIKIKGMGIGLSLVKKIIESYKGKIWVENRVQGDYSKGSNFIILLPLATQ